MENMNRSKLLLNEQPLLVMPQLAAKIGLIEAIVLQQIHYWNTINAQTNNNFKDGYYWTFNSYEQWQEQFPFWSIATIKRTINSLEKKKKLIISANYNKLKIDRTKWYRIDYEALENLETSPLYQNDLTNVSSCTNQEVNMSKPLPETNTETNTKIIKGIITTMNNSPMFLEDYLEAINYYLNEYALYIGRQHPVLSKEHWETVITSLFTVELNGLFTDVSLDDEMTMMDKYFATDFDTDRNILHYVSGNIRTLRCYEECY